MINAMGDVRPSHLLDVGFRQAYGLEGANEKKLEVELAGLVKRYETTTNTEENSGSSSSDSESAVFQSLSRIESLL
jgi:hypothetical protein